jgi:hypothetical protein
MITDTTLQVDHKDFQHLFVNAWPLRQAFENSMKSACNFVD